LFMLFILPPRCPTLFPYTTLFRSFAERRPVLPGLNRSLPDVVHDAAVGLVGVGGVRDRVGMRTRTSGRPLRLPRPARAATAVAGDRKSTRLNSSHVKISYAVFCLK